MEESPQACGLTVYSADWIQSVLSVLLISPVLCDEQSGLSSWCCNHTQDTGNLQQYDLEIPFLQ